MDYKKIRKILEERTSINSETGCWEFDGTNADGYGQIIIDHKHYLVHRLSAQMFLGHEYFPELPHVLHRPECQSRACWNPHHLYLGTDADNMRDTVDAGHARGKYSDATHCVNGHEFTQENTRLWTKPDGKTRRICITCQRKRDEARKFQRSRLKIAAKGGGGAA